MQRAAASWLTRVARRAAAHGARAPLGDVLAPLRERARDAVLDEHRSRAAGLMLRMRSGDRAARNEFAALSERALAQIRRAVLDGPPRRGWSSRCAALADRLWRASGQSEYLDDPDLDEGVRVRILEHLDAVNDLLDFYRTLFDRLVPMLHPSRPTRVLDLAAGHGGFALSLARLARQRHIELELVASDIKPEYLALGEAHARRENLPVRFVVQDALDLDNLAAGSYDVVTSTQSLHHFGAGQVAVMWAEAARVAGRGVLFADGARSALNAAGLCGLGLVLYGDPAFAHDAWVSFRRFFVPEELEVLARLGPAGDGASAAWTPPGHCVLSITRG
jgi:2-polyprenyl-3-methyl-5-hydroxy-6-metoxy-1,4-benzoquinol methylase